MASDSAKWQIVCIRRKGGYVAFHGCPSEKTPLNSFEVINE